MQPKNVNSRNKIIIFYMKQNVFKIITVLFMLMTILLPNLIYLSGSNGYYIKHTPLIPTIYLVLLFIKLILNCIKNKLWLELTRLSILPLMCFKLYYAIFDLLTFSYEQARVNCIFSLIFMTTIIYIQLGSSTKMKNMKELQSFTSVKVQLLITFCPLLFIFLCEKLNKKYNRYSWDDQDYV